MSLLNKKSIIKILILFALFWSCYSAKAQTDSLFYELDSLTFISLKNNSSISKISDNTFDINLEMMQVLPKILGNTDPINFIRTLPGVQTSSEYDSGIHIQGCDNSHNEISINGVPVYGANHLFGLFSVFNPSHYDKMSFSRSARNSNRLGGSIDMKHRDMTDEGFTGDFSLGLLSAQGTLGMKTGKSSTLMISGRSSFLNSLYKRWLHIGGSPIRYNFNDFNLTWSHESEKDNVWIDIYFGKDKAMVNEETFNVMLDAAWGNILGSIHWEHIGRNLEYRNSLWTSGFVSDGKVLQDNASLLLKSHIGAAGYKGQINFKDLRAGLDIISYNIMPQSPESDNMYGVDITSNEIQKGCESSLQVDYDKTVFDRWRINAGLRGTLYSGPEQKPILNASPHASLFLNTYRYGKMGISYYLNRQYIHQGGLSNIGLPIEFWFMSGKYSDPQLSHTFDISYDGSFFKNALAISASVYYKKLYNQTEYIGDLFDFFNSTYCLENHLLKGSGRNYGANLMVHKQAGKLTGWISYSWGRALREFDSPDYPEIYPANHERIHELNAVCCYKINKWSLSSTFVYATGAPFTAPESFYLSAGQILTIYDKHNGCRMRPYIRLDFSANYTLTQKDKRESFINLSIYNVLARDNDVMYRVYTDNGTYAYGPMSFFLKLMPSISYHYKF